MTKEVQKNRSINFWFSTFSIFFTTISLILITNGIRFSVVSFKIFLDYRFIWPLSIPAIFVFLLILENVIRHNLKHPYGTCLKIMVLTLYLVGFTLMIFMYAYYTKIDETIMIKIHENKFILEKQVVDHSIDHDIQSRKIEELEIWIPKMKNKLCGENNLPINDHIKELYCHEDDYFLEDDEALFLGLCLDPSSLGLKQTSIDIYFHNFTQNCEIYLKHFIARYNEVNTFAVLFGFIVTVLLFQVMIQASPKSCDETIISSNSKYSIVDNNTLSSIVEEIENDNEIKNEDLRPLNKPSSISSEEESVENNKSNGKLFIV